MDDAKEELHHFLQADSVPHNLRRTALCYVLGLISTEEGLRFILDHAEYLTVIVSFLKDSQNEELCELAHKCLINISCVASGAAALLSLDECCFQFLLKALVTPHTPFVVLKCQILANATRSDAVCKSIAGFFLENLQVFEKLFNSFNSSDCKIRQDYDYVALLFGNLSRDDNGKRIFLTQCPEHLNSLFSYLTYPYSEIRRIGAAILVKNICFEIDYHKLLLEDIEVLPSVLLPLIGPEDLDDDEMEQLPVICQYLGESKEREPNHFIRILLLEALLKMCSTKYGRNYLRDNGVYFILRELHKWETNAAAVKVCEDVVEILIRDETDVGVENFKDVTIPQHLLKQFDSLTVTTCEIPEIAT